MSDIFVIGQDGNLKALSQAPYEAESVLQELLAGYPALLSGEQLNPSSPRRWLLVSRELGVPDPTTGGDRWSLDHLFLDQDAVPTLVEVKRSSDTRIRREVVGQMLDYAANAVAHWPVERLQTAFESRCEREGKDPEEALQEFIGDKDAANFWQLLKTNLQAGRIRMIFVADVIPIELQRIVEFLNEQLDPAEVVAIEVRRYEGEGVTSLIPRVIGRTVQAQQKKAAVTPGRQWDEESFFKHMQERGDPVQDIEVARKLLEWGKRSMSRIWWGKGAKHASFIPVLDALSGNFYPIRVTTGSPNARVEVQFGPKQPPPFSDEEARKQLLERLNRVPGLALPPDSYNRYPSFALADLKDEESVEQLTTVLDWAVQEVVRTAESQPS